MYVYGQTIESFEGELVYLVSVDMEVEDSLFANKVLDKMKKDGSLYDTLKVYYKDGEYRKELIGTNSNLITVVYKKSTNEIFKNNSKDKFMYIKDASLVEDNDYKIKFVEGNDTILGYKCKEIVITSEYGKETIYYSEKMLPISSEYFSSHKSDCLNIITRMGYLPLERRTEMIFMGFKITKKLIKINERELDSSLFEIPKLKKAPHNMRKMFKHTDLEIMEID